MAVIFELLTGELVGKEIVDIGVFHLGTDFDELLTGVTVQLVEVQHALASGTGLLDEFGLADFEGSHIIGDVFTSVEGFGNAVYDRLFQILVLSWES